MAQWEFACRAGTTTLYSFGDSSLSLRYDHINGPAVEWVAIRLPNGFGLFDMQGNVQEWYDDSEMENGAILRKNRGGGFRPPNSEDFLHSYWTHD